MGVTVLLLTCSYKDKVCFACASYPVPAALSSAGRSASLRLHQHNRAD